MEGMARKKKGALCGGSYVTMLAKNLGVFDQCSNLIHLCPMLPFNLTIMKKIRLVEFCDGRYIPIDHGGTYIHSIDDEEDRPAPVHFPPPLHSAGPSSTPSL